METQNSEKKGLIRMEDKLMTLERTKALIKAIAELEIALNTFYYGDVEGFERINKVYKELKEVKLNYFD